MSGPDGDSTPRDSTHRSSTRAGDGPSSDSADANASRPESEPSAPRERRPSIDDDGFMRWFLRTDDGTVVAIRDVASSVAVVAVVGLVLFGVSGVWPPLVAVESPSMHPNMKTGDLVFVVDESRFVGSAPVEGTGVVPAAESTGDGRFGEPGDVIVFEPNGDPTATPVIHRAHFWVEEGENWVELYGTEANLGGATCDQLTTCPANHDGFVTKGDANDAYDQAWDGANTDVVKPEWITGKGMVRIPWLGHVRLTFQKYLGAVGPVSPIGAPASVGS